MIFGPLIMAVLIAGILALMGVPSVIALVLAVPLFLGMLWYSFTHP